MSTSSAFGSLPGGRAGLHVDSEPRAVRRGSNGGVHESGCCLGILFGRREHRVQRHKRLVFFSAGSNHGRFGAPTQGGGGIYPD